MTWCKHVSQRRARLLKCLKRLVHIALAVVQSTVKRIKVHLLNICLTIWKSTRDKIFRPNVFVEKPFIWYGWQLTFSCNHYVFEVQHQVLRCLVQPLCSGMLAVQAMETTQKILFFTVGSTIWRSSRGKIFYPKILSKNLVRMILRRENFHMVKRSVFDIM